MSSYFEALQRTSRQAPAEHEAPTLAAADANPPTTTLTQLPIAPSIIGNIARDGAIRRLNERVAPLSALGTAVRLLISGCRPGDGASSVAGAIALDLSQRLGMRTLLMDLHLRHPTLQRLFCDGAATLAGDGDGPLLIRATRWPHLELGSCLLPDREAAGNSLLADAEDLLSRYPLAVVDLGVVRLDSRLLALARPADPILLVVRYGHTERAELATTVKALRAANRALGGVVFNAARSPIPKIIRRIFGTGVHDDF